MYYANAYNRYGMRMSVRFTHMVMTRGGQHTAVVWTGNLPGCDAPACADITVPGRRAVACNVFLDFVSSIVSLYEAGWPGGEMNVVVRSVEKCLSWLAGCRESRVRWAVASIYPTPYFKSLMNQSFTLLVIFYACCLEGLHQLSIVPWMSL